MATQKLVVVMHEVVPCK